MKGFLPIDKPLQGYSLVNEHSLTNLQELATNLPKLLLTDRLEKNIRMMSDDDLCVDPVIQDGSLEEIRLAMVQLSFIAHAYILGGAEPKSNLPRVIAKPWVTVSRKLERPPVLSYASYCLDNWYLLNPEESINLNNVALINNFLGGIDEDLSLIHI